MAIMYAPQASESCEHRPECPHLMDEEVRATVFGGDESEAFAGVEPFHSSLALRLLLSCGHGGCRPLLPKLEPNPACLQRPQAASPLPRHPFS